MSYPEKTENDVLIITVSGEIDLENSGNLRQQVHSALDDNKAVSVDMSAVNYIDSSGIAVLIESKQRAGEGSKEFKILKKELLSKKDIFMNTRYLLTGNNNGPSVKNLFEYYGINQIKNYLNDFKTL